MKTTFTASALILATGLIATSSFAANTNTNSLTREQVRAEYQQARADGTFATSIEGTQLKAKSISSKVARDTVKAELVTAKKTGTFNPEIEGQEVKVKQAPSQVTREAVKAEFVAAKKAGTLPSDSANF